MIEVKELTKVYHSKSGDVKALDSISLRLPNAGLVAIYGENGCGKSTLLNLVSTADTEYEGRITFNGTDYRNMITDLRRNVISFVFQEKHFVPYLNLLDNIELFSDMGDEEVINELASFSLLEKKEENTENLSGGQRQRSSFIRGIIKDSKVLLVDEPTSSLNEEMEREVFAKLREYAKEKLVVLVSHNISLIRTFSDLIIHMDKGTISSVENNIKTDIAYSLNEIIVPRGFCDLSVLDKRYIKDRLDNNERVVIRTRDSSGEKEELLNYDEVFTLSWKPPKKLSAKMKKKMIFSAFGWMRRGLVLGICLVSLFAIIINFLCSFALFDKDKFIYENTVKNVDGKIYFVFDESIYENKSNTKLDINSFMEYKKTFSCAANLLENFFYSNQFQFEGEGIYDNRIYGMSLCEEKDVELVFGEFCEINEILITDYAADALTSLSSDYSDYASIIEKGVNISGKWFAVSGIIKTDYKKYLSVYYLDTFINSQKFIDYQNSLQNEYCRIYQNIEQYRNENDIYNVPLEYGAMFSNISTFETHDTLFADIDIYEDGCYINQALFDNIGNVELIKFENYSLYILGVIIDDSSDNMLYVSKEKLQAFEKNQFSNIKAMISDLSKVDQIAFLRERNFTPQTSVGVYINDVMNIITLTSRVFVFLIIILTSFLMGTVLSFVAKIITVDNVTTALMKSSGYGFKAISNLEINKVIISMLIIVLLSNTLFVIASVSLNTVLSKLFGYNITISLLNAKTMTATNIILIIIFAAITFIKLVILNKKQITDLIKQ